LQVLHYGMTIRDRCRSALLAEDQQEEEAEPKSAHGVPIPSDAVDHDLAVLYLPEGVETEQGGDKAHDPDGKVEGVSVGDDVERMAARVGVEEGSLKAELMPCEHLAGEKERAEKEGR